MSLLTPRGSVLIYPPTMENQPEFDGLPADRLKFETSGAPILDPLKRIGGGVWWNKLQILEQRPNLFYVILLQQNLLSADL